MRKNVADGSLGPMNLMAPTAIRPPSHHLGSDRKGRHRLASVIGGIKRGEFLRERQPWPTSALDEHPKASPTHIAGERMGGIEISADVLIAQRLAFRLFSGLLGFQNRQRLPEDGCVHLVLRAPALLCQQQAFQVEHT